MSSMEWVAYRVTRDTLRSMAESGVFKAIGETDRIRGISKEAVLGQFAPQMPSQRGNGDLGESNIPLPGILVTWIGHRRPETGGEVDSDDGVISMLIQLVDRLDRAGRTIGDQNIESYMRWMSDVRESLQKNPYRGLDLYLGDMYHVHVTESISPNNREFVSDNARLVLQVSIFTRTRRNTEGKYHGT